MSSATLPALARDGHGPGGILAVQAAMDDLKAFRTFVAEELKPDLDFGTIPGTGKQTLLQPGAQKIAMFFNACPDHDVTASELGNGHVEYLVKTRLISRVTGNMVGQGLGTCSTMESRYRYRNAGRVCPSCGQETIIVGKAEYGGGFLCFAKKGGCGLKFRDDDPQITSQAVGKAENENIHDVRNTVLKMAVKRSLVSASLALGCASDMFTQDVEDTYNLHDAPPTPQEPRQAPPAREARQAPAPRQEARQAAPQARQDDAAPTSGKGLYRWVQIQEERGGAGKGLLKSLNAWGKERGLPYKMVEWDDHAVSLALVECRRILNPKPQPEPAGPHDDEDWSDDGEDAIGSRDG